MLVEREFLFGINEQFLVFLKMIVTKDVLFIIHDKEHCCYVERNS